MSIAPLSIQQIAAVIRQQIGAQQALPATPLRRPARPDTTARGQQGLNRLIVQRIGALRGDDPDRGRKAFRIFLESLLINELGSELINDPGFYQMVEDIQARMEKIPEVAAAMSVAIDHLLSTAGS